MGETKAQLDTCYSSSSFLKDIMKMTDVDIDPFSDHDKPDSQPDGTTGKTIPLNPGGIGEKEELLGNQSEKCHLEE